MNESSLCFVISIEFISINFSISISISLNHKSLSVLIQIIISHFLSPLFHQIRQHSLDLILLKITIPIRIIFIKQEETIYQDKSGQTCLESPFVIIRCEKRLLGLFSQYNYVEKTLCTTFIFLYLFMTSFYLTNKPMKY